MIETHARVLLHLLLLGWCLSILGLVGLLSILNWSTLLNWSLLLRLTVATATAHNTSDGLVSDFRTGTHGHTCGECAS